MQSSVERVVVVHVKLAARLRLDDYEVARGEDDDTVRLTPRDVDVHATLRLLLVRRVEDLQFMKLVVGGGGLNGAVTCSRDRAARVERERGVRGACDGPPAGRALARPLRTFASAWYPPKWVGLSALQ